MTMKIKLTQGKFALVDDIDYEWLNRWKWCALKIRHKWYAVRAAVGTKSKGLVYMHLEIIKPAEGMKVDHEDGDGLNNQATTCGSALMLKTLRTVASHQQILQAIKASQPLGENGMPPYASTTKAFISVIMTLRKTLPGLTTQRLVSFLEDSQTPIFEP